MRYLMLFLLLVVGPQIEAQVIDLNQQAVKSQMMSFGHDVQYMGEQIAATTMVFASEHHISIGFTESDTFKDIVVFHGGVRFVGTDRSTGSELYLHESPGLVIGIIINWVNRSVQVEYEGTAEHFFFVESACAECRAYIPAPIEIPANQKPSKGFKSNLQRL